MATRDELVVVLAERYGVGDRAERGRILDEFVAVTGFHRKHAMRLLRVGRPSRSSGPRPQRRLRISRIVGTDFTPWWAAISRDHGQCDA